MLFKASKAPATDLKVYIKLGPLSYLCPVYVSSRATKEFK